MTFKKALNKVNKAARVAKDVEALASGDTKKIAKRAKNKAKSKLLGKVGFWKW